MTALTVVFAALLGAVVGSFGNVVVYRLPRGESVVSPGSRCPSCGRRLSAVDLVPVLSWLLLRGRCRTCGARISPRYPLVEALMAGLFAALAVAFPPELHGAAVLPLLVVVAMLVMASLIDLERYLLPDVLTLPALAVALLGSLLWAGTPGLPTPAEALAGALAGAGVLVLINRVGGLALRRLGDTAERLWPVSLDQVNVAALVGAALGVWAGLLAGLASLLLNLVTRRTLRLPEPLLYGLWLLALVLSSLGFPVPLTTAVAGSVLAAGAWAVLGAVYWWLHDAVRPQTTEEVGEEDDEPVAMGFGDVKLAAVLGAFLGWERLLVAVFFAVTLGAVGGVVARLAGGGRLVPFGPYLLLGALASLFAGDAAIAWYLGLFAY
ncbi:MAG TPA: prepilin peptidase [Trueperaceae bacterium]|nr:prepilin peptidase [Trueperaceae bacterium]